MPLPGVPQTFGLESCRDLLDKLQWEIEGFRSEDPRNAEALIYRAFNSAVTAWHIADWVWEDATPEQRASFPATTRRELQDLVRRECRALHLCRQVATASKHQRVTMFPDPNVETVVSAADMITEDADDSSLTIPPIWVIKFVDDGKRIPAIKVFEDAFHYWTQFIYSHRIAA